MSNKVQLDLLVRSGREGDDNWFISDLPDMLWTEFRKRAQELLPEKGDKAWASFLCEAIASVCAGETKTFIMTDIPRKAWVYLHESAKEARSSIDGMFAALLKSAAEEAFHMVKFRGMEKTTGKTHSLVMIGIDDRAWTNWKSVADQHDVTPEWLFAMVVAAAYQGSLSLERTFNGEIPERVAKKQPATTGTARKSSGTKNNGVGRNGSSGSTPRAGSKKRTSVDPRS